MFQSHQAAPCSRASQLTTRLTSMERVVAEARNNQARAALAESQVSAEASYLRQQLSASSPTRSLHASTCGARCSPCDAQWCVGASLILLAADGLHLAARSGRGFDAASGAGVSSAQAQAGASSSGVATSQATTTTTTTVRTGASSSSPGNVDSATAAAFAAMHTENESLRKELRRALGVGLSTASREAAAAGLEGDDSGDVALSAELRAIRARCSELEGHVRRQATVIDVRRAPCVCICVSVVLTRIHCGVWFADPGN